MFHPEGGWAVTQAPQGSVHSPKLDSVQELFEQCSQAHGATRGVLCREGS